MSGRYKRYRIIVNPALFRRRNAIDLFERKQRRYRVRVSAGLAPTAPGPSSAILRWRWRHHPRCSDSNSCFGLHSRLRLAGDSTLHVIYTTIPRAHARPFRRGDITVKSPGDPSCTGGTVHALCSIVPCLHRQPAITPRIRLLQHQSSTAIVGDVKDQIDGTGPRRAGRVQISPR